MKGIQSILGALQKIATSLKCISVNTSTLASKTLTASLEVATGAGVVEAGAITVSFMNTGGTDTTVAGGILAAGQSVSFPEVVGGLYGEIAYDPLSSSLTFSETR